MEISSAETIIKDIREVISNAEELDNKQPEKLSKKEKINLIMNIESEMKQAAANLDFERAMESRDKNF